MWRLLRFSEEEFHQRRHQHLICHAMVLADFNGVVGLGYVGGQGTHHDKLTNPGVAPDGRFWTMSLPAHAVQVDAHSRQAVYQAANLGLHDFHDFVNALTGGPSVPGMVSFRVDWAPSADRHLYRDADHLWQGNFVQNTITCNWSGRTATSEFSTDTNNPTVFAEVGPQHSGVFFT